MNAKETNQLSNDIKRWRESQRKELLQLVSFLKTSFDSVISPSPLGLSFAAIHRSQFRESGRG